MKFDDFSITSHEQHVKIFQRKFYAIQINEFHAQQMNKCDRISLIM